jgi:hypothetical protein
MNAPTPPTFTCTCGASWPATDDKTACQTCGRAWLGILGGIYPQAATFESVRARTAVAETDDSRPALAPSRGDLS